MSTLNGPLVRLVLTAAHMQSSTPIPIIHFLLPHMGVSQHNTLTYIGRKYQSPKLDSQACLADSGASLAPAAQALPGPPQCCSGLAKGFIALG